MVTHATTTDGLTWNWSDSGQELRWNRDDFETSLPARITKAGSQQTYYTIRFLADRDRMLDAYRAYAYFRWLDDRLDGSDLTQPERIAFLERQQSLLDLQPRNVAREEDMLLDLMANDPEPISGLHLYIRNMMAVMTFDVNRRGRLISQQELSDYTQHLSTAVTEALHYFIGHEDPTPQSQVRYRAVAAAHITHLLRDTFEDIAAGYYNIPVEYLEAHGIRPWQVTSDAYRQWVESRVRLARDWFSEGKDYTAQVKNRRCRLAGYAYTARFEWVLNTIEREGYRLRPAYPERKSLRAGLKMALSALSMMF